MKVKDYKPRSYIKVNDIFDELSEEIKRLNEELVFANNCLNVLNKFKLFLSKICVKFEIIIDSEDKQELNQLQEEFSSVITTKLPIRQRNEEINECFNENISGFSEDSSLYDNILFGSQLLEKSSEVKPQSLSKKPIVSQVNKRKKFTDNFGTDYKVNDGNNRHYYEVRMNKYSCYYEGCGHRYDRESRLNEHLKQKHIFEKRLECEECSEEFFTEFDLKEHQLVHTKDSYECEECHKMFGRKSLLEKHKRTHIKKPRDPLIYETPVQCDYEGCRKIFKNLLYMKGHRNLVHKQKERVECDWPGCGQTFKHKKSLKDHRRAHQGIKQFVCDVEGCGKAFSIKCSLYQHKKYHEKPFICTWPDCGQRFISDTELGGHLNRHLDVRPFKCEVEGCGFEYYTERSLRSHVLRIHKK